MFNKLFENAVTRVILIRHGETEWNILGKFQGQTDIKLTENGREQARKLAEFFPEKNLTAIYSSDLSRAMDTAKFVADKFNLTVTPDSKFREMNFGDWEGKTYKEINALWKEESENFLMRPDLLKVPNGENFPILQARAVKRLYELIEKHKGETFAITAHGGVLRTLIANALETPLKNIWRIKQGNTAVSLVSYAEAPAVEYFNNMEHLR